MSFYYSLISNYLWFIKPLFIYILFIKFIFQFLLYITGNLESVFYIFRFIQFDFLPLSFIRLPIMGIINYDFEELKSYEKMIMINNIKVFKIYNKNNTNISSKTKKILYIHGGGFISGDYMSFRSFLLEISKKCNCEIWFPLYSLYPENNINKAIDEINYIYSLENFSNIIADSAGGYLSLNIKNIKDSTKVILISPVFDLSCSSYMYENNKDDINFNKILVKKIFNSISHKIDITNIEKIKNMIIFASRNELFIYDSYKIYSLNQNCVLYVYNSSIHSLPLFWMYNLNAKNCLNHLLNKL